MKTAITFINLITSALFRFRNAANIIFNLTSGLKETRGYQRVLIAIAVLLFCVLQQNILSAQSNSNGVWVYNAELEGHHCDDGGCYTNCTNSYMENSASANNSEPSSTLISAVADWMSKVDGSKKINELSIPGTHDSGAQWGGLGAETQSWDIDQQLEGGIRFFDIRLKPNPDDPNSLAVYHGNFAQCYDTDCFGACGLTCDRLTFTQILTWMNDFLDNHTEEAVIMRIRYEEDGTTPEEQLAFTKTFNDIIESNTSIWDKIWNKKTDSLGANMPVLDALRKKIWIYKHDNVDHDESLVLPYPAGTVDIGPPVVIKINIQEQNEYYEPIASKSELVLNHIKNAPAYIADDIWVLNWTNSAFIYPADMASWINKDVFHAMNEYGNKSLGTIVMDFPGEGLIYRIIKRNFVYDKLVDLTVAIDCYHSLFVGGASDSNIKIKLYNGGFLIGEDVHVAGCNGLGDSFYQFQKFMRAMPQDYTHFVVENVNPEAGDGLGIDEIYISQTRYGLGCYNGGVADDLVEIWGVDGNNLWCLGVEGDDEYGSDAPDGCHESYSFFSGNPGTAYSGSSNAPVKFTEELNYYTRGCIPLEEQAYTVKNYPTIPVFPVALCGPNAPPIIVKNDSTLVSSFTLTNQINMIIEDGVILTIPLGVNLTIDSKSTLSNFGTIINMGKTIIKNDAIAENKPQGIINSLGQYFNFGTTLNEGAIYSPGGYYGQGQGGRQTLINPVKKAFFLGSDNEGGRFMCEKILKLDGTNQGGTWNSSTNTCSIENFDVEEDESLIVDEGVTLKINGLLSNNGLIDNRGIINNANGTINQCGEYTGIEPTVTPITCFVSEEAATCAQIDGIWNEVLQRCTVDGNSTIAASTTLMINPGITYHITGTLTNEGDITNSGNLVNFSTIDNTVGANIYNYGNILMDYDGESGFGSVIVNDGYIRNLGDFQNIIGYGNGGISGNGIFLNQCGGIFSGSIPLTGEFYNEDYPENDSPDAVAKDFLILLDSIGTTVSISPNDVDDGSYDACGIDSMWVSKTDFDCSNIGPNSVVLSVSDKSGNISTDSFIVTVEDYNPPVIITQSQILTLQLDASGYASISPNDIDLGSTDNCEIDSFTLSQTDFDCSNIGANAVVFTATDKSGNTSSVDIIVIIENTYTPNISLTQITTCGETGSITVEIDNSNDTYSFDNGLSFGISNIKTGLEAGRYNVIVQKINGCYSVTKPVTITFPDVDGDGICDVSIPTGIEDEILVESIRLYPNPASDVLTIEAEIPIKKVEFYSFVGTKVKEVHSDFKAISLNDLLDGVYLVKVYSENGFENKKMVKQ